MWSFFIFIVMTMVLLLPQNNFYETGNALIKWR
jgi:hypothetical protein